ncbi:hypothetical protein Peur_037774 [Populus x canadensis]
MKRALRANNKLGFVDGSITKPTDPNDPLLDAWERCNDMIVSWIHNSDFMSWTTIGLGEMKNGLYQFQHIQVSPTTLMCKLSKYFDTHRLHSACTTILVLFFICGITI